MRHIFVSLQEAMPRMIYLRSSLSRSLARSLAPVLLIILWLVLARYRMNAWLYDPIAQPITDHVCTPVDYALAVYAHRGTDLKALPVRSIVG